MQFDTFSDFFKKNPHQQQVIAFDQPSKKKATLMVAFYKLFVFEYYIAQPSAQEGKSAPFPAPTLVPTVTLAPEPSL